MKAQVERTYDEYERMATEAMMHRAAQNKETLRSDELFKRPNTDVNPREEIEELRDEMSKMNDWLSTLQVKKDREEDNQD